MTSGFRRTRTEATRLRNKIASDSDDLRQGIDILVEHVHALARRPEALPVAFGLGFMAERLRLLDLKDIARFLPAHLTVLQIASALLQQGRSR